MSSGRKEVASDMHRFVAVPLKKREADGRFAAARRMV